MTDKKAREVLIFDGRYSINEYGEVRSLLFKNRQVTKRRERPLVIIVGRTWKTLRELGEE